MTDAARMYIPGYFKEELGGEKLSALLPEKLSRDTVISAAAGFDGEGKLLEVFLEAKAPICDNTVYVTFSKGNLADCYIFPDNPVASLLNGIYFTVFQKAADENNYMLDAYAEINGWTMRVSYTATSEALEKAKEEFSQIIFLFSSYKDGNPDFSAISPDSIPEYYDRKLSLSEAYADPDFGSYMIRDIPDGFSEESIRRYKAQSNNCLSGLWSKGLAYLSINISAFNEDASARLTDIGQTENYDLSLYPIPRADSVPESLREIVDNPIFNASELTLEAVYKRTYKVNDAGDADGPRMAFSVKYDNVIVEIRAKGITPEWIYHTLKQLLNK